MAAMTGRKLRVRDCRAPQGRRPENPVYSTDFDSGSLICWPVRSRTSSPSGASRGGVRVAAPADERPPFAQLEDVEVDAERNDQPATALEAAEGVLAVIQVRCADGELSAEAVEVLHGIGRLVVPLLTEALARDEEYVRRRSTEALLSLNSIVPREMGLIAMIEEVVRVAQRLTEAERVCFFFVDEAADELWVAKSVDFDDAKIKIGQGLCGHAAATGGIVNVIDSYKDSRFDRSWDQQTGFVTKRCAAVCVSFVSSQLASTKLAGWPMQNVGGSERVSLCDVFCWRITQSTRQCSLVVTPSSAPAYLSSMILSLLAVCVSSWIRASGILRIFSKAHRLPDFRT